MAKLLDESGLRALLRDFVAERDWGQFHTPKNLALALAGEVGELCAELQWLTEDEVDPIEMPQATRAAVAAEAADVAIYLVRLCDRLQIDLNSAVVAKIAENRIRYPIENSKGSAAKSVRPSS